MSGADGKPAPILCAPVTLARLDGCDVVTAVHQTAKPGHAVARLIDQERAKLGAGQQTLNRADILTAVVDGEPPHGRVAGCGSAEVEVVFPTT